MKIDLVEKITNHGIENCLFLVPMRPQRTVFGMFAHTCSSDEEVIVPAKITEERYKISENYKITLQSIYPIFGKEHFYISDLGLLIDDGRVEVFFR